MKILLHICPYFSTMPGVVEEISHLLTVSSKVFSVGLLNNQKDTSATQLFSILHP